MKSTGFVRKVDDLGRIVIPKELRTSLNISIKEPLEIIVDGESIILKKYTPPCVLCNNVESVKQFKGKNICHSCITKITC